MWLVSDQADVMLSNLSVILIRPLLRAFRRSQMHQNSTNCMQNFKKFLGVTPQTPTIGRGRPLPNSPHGGGPPAMRASGFLVFGYQENVSCSQCACAYWVVSGHSVVNNLCVWSLQSASSPCVRRHGSRVPAFPSCSSRAGNRRWKRWCWATVWSRDLRQLPRRLRLRWRIDRRRRSCPIRWNTKSFDQWLTHDEFQTPIQTSNSSQ